MPGYRELHEICRGPDLAIYRAVDATGRPVVLKTLAPGFAPDAIERARTVLCREHELLSELDDPGTVKALALDDLDDEDGKPALVVEPRAESAPQGA